MMLFTAELAMPIQETGLLAVKHLITNLISTLSKANIKYFLCFNLCFVFAHSV